MPRDGHAAVVLFNTLFIFGGDRHRMSFNDLSILPLNAHILDCHQMKPEHYMNLGLIKAQSLLPTIVSPLYQHFSNMM